MKNRKLPLIVAFFTLSTALGLYGQDHKTVLQNYFNSHNTLGKSVSNPSFIINAEDASQSLKATVVKIQQTYNDIPVYGSYATVLLRDNSVLSLTGSFSGSVAKTSQKATIGADKIYSISASKLGLENPSYYDTLVESGEIQPAKLVYFDQGNQLILAYEFTLEEKKSSNMWNIVANASNGEILVKENLTVSCNFHDEPFSRDHLEKFHTAENSLFTVEHKKIEGDLRLPFLAENASYRVFPYPVESPRHGERVLLQNPWDPSASPLGWQATHTTVYNITRGNNVLAYMDEMSTNPLTNLVTANGGDSRTFDFPFEFPENYNVNKDASITNLFYSNNMVHDILYRYGFTETAKNFQLYNFGLGGEQNDFVQAESRDGGGVADLSLGIYNNANFATPPDGYRPRMQMYVWRGAGPYFKYNEPNAGTSISQVGFGYFGVPLWKAPTTGNIGVASSLEACTELTAGSLTGKIGIAQRGNCSFITKVKNMEDAGAIAAIVYDNVTGAVSNMSGDGSTTVTIPSVFIPKVNGEQIVNNINAGQNVNVTLSTPFYDSSMDHSIVIHEYGHGVSNRLTGDGYSCLQSSNSKEQMGEGWSDFLALMLTLKPTDNASVGRGIGTYAAGQNANGTGIRQAKYTPNMNINGYTYGDTNGMEYTNSNGQIVPDSHSIGFVWATMLWDLHWDYAEKYGFDSDIVGNPESGSGKVLQMVVNGMKLQPCSPTFIDGRDAILAADEAANNSEDKCLIWNAFAKRGLGVNASAGSKTNINDQVEDFTVPEECEGLATTEVASKKAISIYPNPAKNEFALKFNSKVTGKVFVEIFDASGKIVSNQKVDPSITENINIQHLPNGVYIVKASGIGVDYSTKLIVNN